MANEKNPQAAELDQQTVSLSSDFNNMDKIRELLFGGHMRDFDRRFQSLEDKISKESANIRKDMDKRLETLENFIKKNVEKLTEKQQQERSSRTDALKDLQRQLQQFEKNTEKDLERLDNSMSQEVLSINNQLHDQSKELLTIIQQVQDDSTAALNDEANRLTDQKVNREDLADLFTELALRLNKRFDITQE